MSILELKTTVLPGGIIKIDQIDLPAGQEVTVRISLDQAVSQRSEAASDLPGATEKKSFLENLGGYQGGQLFKTGAEVDQYIREERESWDD